MITKTMKLKRTISRHLFNIPGWRTNRKIVVIESDDWGSIRMPSKEVFNELMDAGIKVDNLSFNCYDSLASEEDLLNLFQVLESVNDKNGNPAIITANTIVANPDFNKISASNFKEYHYEPFTQTLKRYPSHSKSYDLWMYGIKRGIFKPQFHGREHLNVVRWMKALRNDLGFARIAFDKQMYDLSESLKITENSYVDALNFESEDELEFQIQSIKEGLELFEELFGYKSKTFIAPCYIWSQKLNKTLHDMGVESIQCSRFQNEPMPGKDNKFRKVFHYTGQRNKIGQYYLVRNVFFEPSAYPDFDWIDDSLEGIKIAFRMGKPAIICSHRFNYIGNIDPSNRERNLDLLRCLLKEIVKKYPDTEFMSSEQLANLIISSKFKAL